MVHTPENEDDCRQTYSIRISFPEWKEHWIKESAYMFNCLFYAVTERKVEEHKTKEKTEEGVIEIGRMVNTLKVTLSFNSCLDREGFAELAEKQGAKIC